MFYVLYCIDRPDGGDIRPRTREAHLGYAAAEPGRSMIRLAGPLLGDDGTTMVGSLFILEAADEATVRRFNAADPYTRAGLFERVEIHPFRWLLGDAPR